MGVNAVVLVGRLTRDPEHQYTPQGVAVANMGLAVDRMTKKEDGSYEVDFFNVIAWRNTADFAAKYLGKGRLVCVQGRIQIREYVDQATGAKKKYTEIIAERISGLDKPSGDVNGNHTRAEAAEMPDKVPAMVDGDDPYADE